MCSELLGVTIVGDLQEASTPWAGASLLVELFRRLGVDAVPSPSAEGLELLKKVALPEEYAQAHPKRLRFSVFTIMGRLLSHAGRVLLRIADDILEALIAPAQRSVRRVVWDTS